jgi:hypothetical protein
MKYLGILMIVTMTTSCLSEKFMVSPPFTSTDEITALSVGMTQLEVETTLGIAPYEVLSLVDGSLWVTYNYRMKNFITPITSFSKGIDQATPNRKPTNVDDLEARNAGEVQYGDWGVLYVQFDNGIYASSFSDSGMDKSNGLESMKASLKNHSTKGPIFFVNKKGYVENENGVLQSIDKNHIRDFVVDKKTRNKRSNK